MKNLSMAIYSKVSSSGGFWEDIGGRFYKNIAPISATYPLAIYKMVYDNNAGTFQEDIEDCLFQFSLFSADYSTLEVENLYTKLKNLFDKCLLNISGNTHLHMLRQSSTLFQDELENPDGRGWVWHYAVDYNIMMQKNG